MKAFLMNLRSITLAQKLILSILFTTWVLAMQSFGQCPASNNIDIRDAPCNADTANCSGSADVTLISVSLGDPNVTCESCQPGSQITLPMIVEIRSDNNGNRCTFTISSDLYINGIYQCEFSVRLDTCVSNVGTYFFEFGQISYSCGELIQLINTTVGWATNSNNNGNSMFCPQSSKCSPPGPITVQTPLVASCIVADSINCFGEMGQVTAIVTGGTRPYSFSWSPGGSTDSVITVGPGTYNLTLTDADNCTSTCTVVLPDGSASPIAAVCVDDTLTCNGFMDGEVSVNPSGGTIPYSYLWDANAGSSTSQTVSNLGAGSYTVTVTDNNDCAATCTSTILEPTALSCMATSTAATCNGASDGSISVAASGGSGSFEYSLDSIMFQASNLFSGLAAGDYTITVRDPNANDPSACTSTCNVTVGEPTALSCTATPTDATCNGASDGCILVSATGGSGSYQYSLDGGPFQTSNMFSGLSAGSYTITVRDPDANDPGTCTTTCSTTVGEPTVLSCTAISNDATCNGASDGSISVSATGGSGSFQYSIDGGPFQISNMFTGLAAGNYTITVRDPNASDPSTCTTTCNATVDQPIALSCTATPSDATCNGASDGSISVSATGGSGTYQYSVGGGPFQTSNMFSGLAAGNHTVTVRDPNASNPSTCTTTCNATIGEPMALSCMATSTDATCNGASDGSISVSASGGSGNYQYSINGGPFQASSMFTGLAAGNYTITVRDPNATDPTTCITTCNTTIGEPTALSCMATSTDATCNGASDGSISVSASGGSGSYQYSINGGPFQTSNLFTGLAAGNYTVTVRDPNATDPTTCTTTCSTSVGEPTALSCSTSTSPASCNGGSDGAITVTASGGSTSYEYSIDGGPFQASNMFTGLPAGNYTLTVRDADANNPSTCATTCEATVGEASALSCSATPTDATCNGASDGSISVSATGGSGSYQFSINGGPFQTSNIFTGLAAASYTITVRDPNSGDPDACNTTCNATVNEPAALSCTATPTDATCNGAADGSISVSATGGSGSYQYSLDGSPFQTSNIFTGLPAGNYTVTVQDPDATDPTTCTTTCSASVGEPTALSCIAAPSDATCNGASDGSISVSASGGSGSFEYSINGGPFQASNMFTGLLAGNYTVTVRDPDAADPTSCTTTCSTSVGEPTSLSCTATPSDATCNGTSDGSISVSATGGSGSFEYSINGGPFQTSNMFTGLPAGNYTVTVQDPDATDPTTCTTTCSASVGEPSALSCSTSTSPASCNGGSDGTVTVTASGGSTSYEYSIDGGLFQASNMFTGLPAGNYTITVRDRDANNPSACTTTCEATVGEASALSCTATSTAATCNGASDGSISVSAMGGSGSYQYSLDGSPFQTSNMFTGLSAGDYTVTVRDPNSSDPDACNTTCNATVSEPAALSCTANAADATCNGAADGSISVSATGGSGSYEYSLDGGPFQTSNMFTGLQASDYTITVRDPDSGSPGTCTTTCNATVGEPLALSCAAIPTAATCNGASDGSISVSATGGSGSYQYSIEGGPFQTSNMFTGLAAGNYTITVRDPGASSPSTCTTTCNATISEPASLACNVNISSHVTCFGSSDGSATVSVMGGTAPFQYGWSHNASETGATSNNLPQGLHTVTVTDANLCETTCQFTITQPDSLIATASFSCNVDATGDIDLMVNGGTSPYSYSWSNGFMGEDPMSVPQNNLYSVTVIDDQGCSDTTSLYVMGCCLLELSCPTTTNVSCFDDTTDFIADSLEILANIVASPPPCITPQITLLDRSASGDCGSGGFVIVRTYEITDGVTTIQCNKRVVVLDNANPILNCPSAVVIECITELPPPLSSYDEFILAGGGASDNCGININSWSYLGESIVGSCPTVVRRTYIIEDLCGNVGSCVRTITIQDTTAPVVDFCPDNINMGCTFFEPDLGDLSPPITDPLSLGASDNCSNVASLVVSSADRGPFVDGCIYRFERVYTITDECGNTTVCPPQVFTFTYDNEPPVFSNVPADLVIDCFDPIPPGGVGGVTAFDDCSGSLSVSYEEIAGNIGCLSESYQRIWTAVDGCGNVGTAIQNITRSDLTEPVITRPNDTTIHCGTAIPPASFDISDDCTSFDEVFNEIILSGSCGCEYTIMRTWYAQNLCGAIARDTQYIHVIDTTAPVIKLLNPALIGLEDGETMISYNCDPPEVLMTDILVDDCCETEILTYDSLLAFNACDIFGYYQRWACGYVVTDLCGNQTEFRFYVEQFDTAAPYFVYDSSAASLQLDCEDTIPPEPLVLIDDNCPNDPMVLFTADTVGIVETDSFAVIRTWEATDQCQNVSQYRQIIEFCGFRADSFIATIGNIVWFDENKNGMQDRGEPGINGVTVNLYRDLDRDSLPDQEAYRTTTTRTWSGQGGLYFFQSLNPGYYFVEFIPDEDQDFTLFHAGSDDNMDSDVDPSTGMSPLIAVGEGETNIAVDAGLTSLVVLPIELAYFNGFTDDCVNRLRWATTFELNNDGFSVQRSTDGVEFVPIGFLEGKGNTSLGHEYIFTDTEPAIENYYRLEQVDADGTVNHSEVVKLGRNCSGLVENIEVFPNPVHDRFTLRYQLTDRQVIDLKIFNHLGQLIKHQNGVKMKGIHHEQIDLASLPNGLYWIQVVAGSRPLQKSIIKNN